MSTEKVSGGSCLGNWVVDLTSRSLQILSVSVLTILKHPFKHGVNLSAGPRSMVAAKGGNGRLRKAAASKDGRVFVSH